MECLVPLNDAKFAAQTTTYTGTAGTLTGWMVGAKAVHVVCSTDAYVRVGEGVTATTADTYVPAFSGYVFMVPYGTRGTWTVSAIQVSSGGSVYAKPLQG